MNIKNTAFLKLAVKLAQMIVVASILAGCGFENQKNIESKGNKPWHVLMLDSEMHRNPQAYTIDFETKPKWNYTQGLVLMAALKIWKETGDQRYYTYVKSYYDEMIDQEGNILYNYKVENYNIDHIKPGINLYDLYEETGDERYHSALKTLRGQLKTHPRTSEGCFWHKNIYPNQVWLDGVYMNAPFYARYGKVFDEPENFDDIANQILLVEQKTLDPATGLLYHAWDESRSQQWANPQTGQSPNFWGRAMGWYAMALVDVLDYFPADHAGRLKIVQVLERLVKALIPFQDPETGLWYQVVDQGGKEGNYLEASASAMYAYAIAKAVNNHLLEPSYMSDATKAFQGILDHLITFDNNGDISLNQICGVAGLGGNPYRDGSYEYYINEIIRSNDPKGVGPFMLLSMEIEKAGFHLKKNKLSSEQ